MLLDSVQKRIKVNNSVWEKIPLMSSSLLQQQQQATGGGGGGDHVSDVHPQCGSRRATTMCRHTKAGRQCDHAITHADPK